MDPKCDSTIGKPGSPKCRPKKITAPENGLTGNKFLQRIDQAKLSASQLLAGYCISLYNRLGTFEAVAKVTKLDRRTVKKYIVQIGNKQTQAVTAAE